MGCETLAQPLGTGDHGTAHEDGWVTVGQPMGSDMMWGTHGSPSDEYPRPPEHQSWGIFRGHSWWPRRTTGSRVWPRLENWVLGGRDRWEGEGTPPGRAVGWGKHDVGGSGDGGGRHVSAPAPGRCLTRAGVRRQLPLLQLPLLGDAGSLPALAAGLRLASGDGTVCAGRQRGWHRRRGCARPTLPVTERWGDGRTGDTQALRSLLAEKLPKFGRIPDPFHPPPPGVRRHGLPHAAAPAWHGTSSRRSCMGALSETGGPRRHGVVPPPTARGGPGHPRP